MARYVDLDNISVENLKKRDPLYYIYYRNTFESGATSMLHKLAKLPTADVRENVHGEWDIHFIADEKYLPKFTQICICKRCGEKLYRYEGQKIDFCTGCGTDMRKFELESEEKDKLQRLVDDLESGCELCVSAGMGGYDLPDSVNNLVLKIIKKAIKEG